MIPWSPAPLVLVARGVDADRDIGRLLVQQDVDVAVAPVEPVLLVSDAADRAAHGIGDLFPRHAVRAAHLAGKDNAPGGCKGLAGDPAARISGEIQIDDRVGNQVADLVRMALGDGLAGEDVTALGHRVSPLP